MTHMRFFAASCMACLLIAASAIGADDGAANEQANRRRSRAERAAAPRAAEADAAAASSLRCGAAVRDITPRYPLKAPGIGGRKGDSAGVLEPLTLGCLAIADDKTTVLMVTLDMLGQTNVNEELCALIEEETGIAYPRIMIAWSHTHYAPALKPVDKARPGSDYQKYSDEVRLKLVEAARESLANLRPARLETARIQVPSVLYNRRVKDADGMSRNSSLYPQKDLDSLTFSPTDPELTVFRFVDENGVQAVLVNFGCHPTAGGPMEENPLYKFSADYPHYVRRTIADAWHCPVFFTLGAAGDAVAIKRVEDSRERIGSVLGNSAILAERAYRPSAAGDLEVDVIEMEADRIAKTEENKAALAAGRPLIGAPDPAERETIRLQYIRIGDTTLVGWPFEVLAEIGLRMKARFPRSVLVSCAGGRRAYLPLEHEFARGGYEVGKAAYMPDTADRLLDAALKRLEKASPLEK